MRLGASPTRLHQGTRIIADELVHAEQAFAVLSEAGGGQVELGGALGLERNYGLGVEQTFDERCRQWGFRSALEEALERDYRPRFRDYGIEVP